MNRHRSASYGLLDLNRDLRYPAEYARRVARERQRRHKQARHKQQLHGRIRPAPGRPPPTSVETPNTGPIGDEQPRPPNWQPWFDPGKEPI